MKRLKLCIPAVKRCLSGWAGQELCHQSSWKFKFPLRPMFFKDLKTFWALFPKFNKSNTLLLDDSLYKCHMNDEATYIVLPSVEQQTESQWLNLMLQDVLQLLQVWVESKDRGNVVKTCPFDVRKENSQTKYLDLISNKLKEGGKINAPEQHDIPRRPASQESPSSDKKKPYTRYKRPGER